MLIELQVAIIQGTAASFLSEMFILRMFV